MRKAVCILLSVLMLATLAGTSMAASNEPSYVGKTVILYTGNLRGNLDVYPQIAQAKKDYEAKGAEVILVDAGNFLQGSAAANADRGLTVYELMDAAGYDAAGMGLAEFGYADAVTGYPYHGNVTKYHTQAQLQLGTEELTYNVNKDGSKTAVLSAKAPAKFKTAASNVTALKEGVYAFESSVLIEKTLKVRFYSVLDPKDVQNVQDGYLALREPVAETDGADVTVLLTTGGRPDSLGNADIVIDASGNASVTGAYVIDNVTKTVTREELTLSGSDETVSALVDAARERTPEALGRSDVILMGADSRNRNLETNLGDLTADALLWYAEHYIEGFDKSLPLIAIQNGGNCDSFLYTGDITETDLLEALPFSPMGVGVLQVTGEELLETLEAASQTASCPGFAQVAGFKYRLDLTKEYDGGAAYGKFFEADSVNRVTVTEVNGKLFDPDAVYNLVCDNYLVNGSDTYYTLKAVREGGAPYVNNGPGVKTRDIVAMYIQNELQGVVGEKYAAPQGRIAVCRDFADVSTLDGFDEAVHWAAEAGVTNGVGGALFAPDALCTREQALTMLWRASGKPASDSPVTYPDAAEGTWYFEAVQWASNEKIFREPSGESFGVGTPCKASELAAWLERLMGEPTSDASGEPLTRAGAIELVYRYWNR